MKKVRILLIAVFACLLAFCLSACGGDKKDTGGATVPDPEKVKGEKVTAEQWAAAFDMRQVRSVTAKTVQKRTHGEREDSLTTSVKFDGDKTYMSAVETYDGQSETEEMYFGRENDTVYAYTFDAQTQTWRRAVSESGYWNDFSAAALAEEFLEAVGEFGDFTYDPEVGAYVYQESYADEDENGAPVTSTTTAQVKITDGKLAVLQMKESDGKNAYDRMLQFYNYGTTTVTLPQVSDIVDETEGKYTNITTDEINGAAVTVEMVIELKKDNKCTMTFSVIKGSETEKKDSVEGVYKIDGDKITITVNSEDIVGSIENDSITMNINDQVMVFEK